MCCSRYNITILQGATFEIAVSWKNPDGTPVVLSGYTARMQVRGTFASTAVIVEATTANGRITITEATGTLAIKIGPTVTAALAAPATGVYDLELVSAGGDVYRILEGGVRITPEVTR